MALIMGSLADCTICQPQPTKNAFFDVKSLTPPKEEKAELGNVGTFSSTLVVSPAVPLKRKSTDLGESEKENFVSSKHILQDSTNTSTATPPPRTPSDSGVLQRAVSVVVPSPSLALDRYVKFEPRLNGLSERYFPVESVRRAEVSMRRYPASRTTKRALVSLSANLDDSRHGPDTRNPSSETLEVIQRSSLAHSLARLRANGPEVLFSIDNEKLFMLASNFGFVQDYVLRDGVEPASEEFKAGCDCAGGVCQPDTCTCLTKEEKSDKSIVPYRLDKRALAPDFLGRKSLIHECNHRCGCRGMCWFNVIQRGRRFRLEIFDTETRGLGKSLSRASSHF